MIGISTQRATFPVVATITENSHFSRPSMIILSSFGLVSPVIIAALIHFFMSDSYMYCTSSILSESTNHPLAHSKWCFIKLIWYVLLCSLLNIAALCSAQFSYT